MVTGKVSTGNVILTVATSSQQHQAIMLNVFSPSSVFSSASDAIESDETTLMRRQKNIDYGKTGESYKFYLSTIPK